MTPHHRVTFEKPISYSFKEKRSRPAFVRMVSDAKLSHPKRMGSPLSRQESFVAPRTRKRAPSDAGSNTGRSSSEHYLSRTVSILEPVDSDEGEPDENKE